MGAFDDLPTLADVEASRVGKPLPKGKSRLELTEAEKPLTIIDARKFKADVWTRDYSHCRRCLGRVRKCLARVADRGEVHHIHGKIGDLLFEVRAAILLCLHCHELVTGRVNERWIIVATQTFVLHEREYTDATFPVTFERVA